MLRFCFYFIMVVVWFGVEIEGACFRVRPQLATTVDSEGKFNNSRWQKKLVHSTGKNVTRNICTHLNKTYEVNTTWNYPYPECMECRCSSSGLSCCGYVTHSHSIRLIIFIGKDMPCTEELLCTLHVIFIFCFRYGISAGVFEPPEGCQLASGTCEVQLVKKSDPSKPCIETESSTTTTTTEPTTTRRKKCFKKGKSNDTNLRG